MGFTKKVITINAPNMQEQTFVLHGTTPLVVHRFSQKTKIAMEQKAEAGSTDKKNKKRDKKNYEETFNEARYISKAGWDGVNAAAFREAMISACRLVGYTMTLAKLSIFCVPDDYDKSEPIIPLVRIIGKPEMLKMWARTSSGEAYISSRPIYKSWSMKVRIRFDADQFTLKDITNLLLRVGIQVGICEGRPDSPKSCGMGWGLFDLERKE